MIDGGSGGASSVTSINHDVKDCHYVRVVQKHYYNSDIFYIRQNYSIFLLAATSLDTDSIAWTRIAII